MSDRFDDLDERHDDQCEGDGGGMLNCSCGPRQQQRVLAELHALRAATPSSGVTEGKAENSYPFMTIQDAIETAILARGVDAPDDLADVVFVAAEAVQALWAAAPSDDPAEVLAGLRVEMVALADDAFGFEGAGLFRDAVRQSVALVEAAQARLADRGQGGGER